MSVPTFDYTIATFLDMKFCQHTTMGTIPTNNHKESHQEAATSKSIMARESQPTNDGIGR